MAEGRGRTHQCIRTESHLPCYPGICQRHHESTPYSGAYGQLYGGVIHKQTKGDTFTNSGVVGVRDMEFLHLSADMDYSETCSRSDQHRCRFCVEELQRSNGMDTQQDGIPENNQEGSIRQKWTYLPLGLTTSYHTMWPDTQTQGQL